LSLAAGFKPPDHRNNGVQALAGHQDYHRVQPGSADRSDLTAGSRFFLKPYHAQTMISEIRSLIGP
jgi:hypothetical protein